MDQSFTIHGYTITDDPELFNEISQTPADLMDQMAKIHRKAIKGGQKNIDYLIRKIKEYPNVPQLKNYLSVALMNTGHEEKAYEVNDRILEEHPDYLFGIMNKAREYRDKGDYHKMPEVLGKQMELKALCPNRQLFHVSEVVAFYFETIRYYTAVGDIESAQSRLDMLRDIAPDHDDVRKGEYLVLEATLESARENITAEERARITPEFSSYDASVQTDQPPEFTHKLIHELYTADYGIDREVLAGILAMPRESLIDDLRKVLRDSICRFEYFKEMMDEGEIEPHQTFSPFHAVSLLGELEAGEAINDILDTLRQGEDFADFWYGDFLLEVFWQPLYKLVDNNLDVLGDFMLEPGVYTYAKSTVSKAVIQYYFRHPDKRDQIKEWYKGVLLHFLTWGKENLTDTDLMGFVVSDVIDGNFRELIPAIDGLYEAGCVNESICGSLKDVHKAFGKRGFSFYKMKVLSIYDLYDYLEKNWSRPTDDLSEKDSVSEFVPEDEPVDRPFIKEPKVGRNDPCPCGSGKKYKKCCMRKT